MVTEVLPGWRYYFSLPGKKILVDKIKIIWLYSKELKFRRKVSFREYNRGQKNPKKSEI